MTVAATQPLHTQIRNGVLRRIEEGTLRPGDRLPSESEIMRQYNVSRGTVTRAMRDLEVTGVLHRRRGSGTYVRETAGANGRGSPQMSIAMFTPWAGPEQAVGAFHVQLHHGISRVCTHHHAELSLQVLSPAGGTTQREQVLSAARSLAARKPKVVLYCGLELPHEEMSLNDEVLAVLQKAGIAIVVIDRDTVAYPRRSQHTWVSYDNRRGGTLLVEHMVEQGYKRIAFVSIEQDSTAVFERLAGYYDGLRLAGIRQDSGLVFETATFPDEELCDRLLKSKPDAVICKDTTCAAKLGFILSKRGYKIGDEIGLAGFDDDPIASMLPVPLTVVRQPVEPFAAAVYQVASTLAEGSNDCDPLPTGSRVVIPVELVARRSTSRS